MLSCYHFKNNIIIDCYQVELKYSPLTGKVLPVRTVPTINKVKLLEKSIDKHAAHDRSFAPYQEYTLMGLKYLQYLVSQMSHSHLRHTRMK